MKMSEWAMEPLAGNVRGIVQSGAYNPGLNTHRQAAHIVLYHRYEQRLEEELISPVVILAMRNMYQSTFGLMMRRSGMFKYLQVRHPAPEHALLLTSNLAFVQWQAAGPQMCLFECHNLKIGPTNEVYWELHHGHCDA